MRSIADVKVVRGVIESQSFFAVFALLFMAVVLLWSSPAWAQATEANLSITKEGPARVEPSEEFEYVLTVSNAAGAAPATNVVVTDDLPSGVTLVRIDSPRICTNAPGDTRIVCRIPTLAAGSSREITLTVTATTIGTIRNRASADSRDEPAAPVNSDAVTTRVVPDLVIDKLDDPDPVDTEGRLIYTLRVENQGNTTAENIRVRDALPIEDLNVIDVESGAFDCRYGAGILRCTGGTLASGDVGTVRVIVEPEVAGTIENTASVSVQNVRAPIDSDTQTTTVRESDTSEPTDPGDSTDTTESGDDCTRLLTLDGNERKSASITVPKATNRLRVVYGTSSPDGSLKIELSGETLGRARNAIDKTISGRKTGVFRARVEPLSTYNVVVSPTDQSYKVTFETAGKDDGCTTPTEQGDVLTETIPDDELPDTGGSPISVPAVCAVLLLVGAAMIENAARRRR